MSGFPSLLHGLALDTQGEEEAGNDVLLENTINMVVVLGNEIV
jgi:hypothetical protein|tara:strand:- start:25444 stop:25572 length:129 start_codon:yes stop_codon:yes gene_type:complete